MESCSCLFSLRGSTTT